MVDMGRALKSAVETGDVRLGLRRVRRALAHGEARLLVLAANCPDDALRVQEKVKVVAFEGNGMELGAACGKPFAVAGLAVVDPGKSNILSA